MAEINRDALVVTRGPKLNGDEPTPGARALLADQAPKVRVLANSRILGAQQIIDTVGQFNPDRITLKQRQQMRRDPMIQMGLHYIRVPLLSAPYHFECEDPAVAEFVKRCYDKIHVRLVNCLLSALDFGYSGTVKRFELAGDDIADWKYEDKETGEEKPVWPDDTIKPIVWNDPRPLPPRGLHPTFNEQGEEDKFTGMRHDLLTQDIGDGKALEVDAAHSAWFINERDQSFGDWYGYPRTGYALRYWWSYWYNWLLGDRHFEQDADPPLVVHVPEGVSTDPDDPAKTIPNTDVGLRIGQYLRDGATIAIPSTPYTGESGETGARTPPQWAVEFLRGGENMKAFQDRFEYLDVMKLRAVLVPEQALVEGKGGTSSRNVAATYGAVFAAAQEILAGELDQHINDYWIPDLVRQNFQKPPVVKKVTTGFREEDMTLVGAILTAAATNDLAALKINFEKLLDSVDIPTLTPEEQAQQELEQQRRQAADAAQNPPPPPGAGGGTQPPPPSPGGGGTPPPPGGGRAGASGPPAPARGGGTAGGGGGGVTIDGQPLNLDLGSLPDIEPYSDPQVRKIMAELYSEVEQLLGHVYGTHRGDTA